MKYRSLLLLLAYIACPWAGLLAQVPFQLEISYPGGLTVNSLIETPNGSSVIAGIAGNTPTQKGFLMRVDPCGELEWMRLLEVGPQTEIQHAILSIDGGYVMTGRYLDPTTGWDLFVIKTNGAGTIQWTQNYRGANADGGFAIVDAELDGYRVAGYTRSFSTNNNSDILLLSLNLQGQINWQRQFGGPHQESGVVLEYLNPGGDILVAGATNSFLGGGPYDGFLLSVNTTGQLNWFNHYDLGAMEAFRGLVTNNNGEIYLSGYTDFSNASQDYDPFLLKTNANGTPLWARTYDTGAEERAFQLSQYPNGDLVLGGFAFGTAGGDWDLFGLKTDSLGSPIWGRSFGSPFPEVQNPNNMYYTVGVNQQGGIWTGGTILDPNSAAKPILTFTDSAGNINGDCPEYPLTVSSSTVSFQQFSSTPDVNAFGFSTPVIAVNTSVMPSLDNLCENLSLSLGADTTLCTGDSLLLSPTPFPGASYLWQDGTTQSSLLAKAAGIYWVEITVNGCPRRDSIEIDYFPPLALFPIADTLLCAGNSLTLIVPPGLSQWTWQDGSQAPTQIVTQSGIYRLRAFDGQCWQTDSISVQMIPLPSLNLGPDTAICPGSSLRLDGTLVGASYLWQDGSTNAFLLASNSGQYSLTRSIGHCSVSDTINLSLRIPPQPQLGPDTTLCLGENLQLAASIGGNSFQWQDGSTGNTFLVQTGGLFWVEVDDGFCAGRDSIEIAHLFPTAVDLGPDTTICAGSPLVLDPGFPGTDKIWQGQFSQGTLTVDTTGWYVVRVIAPLCEDQDSIFVTVVPSPVISLPADTLLLCETDSLLVGPTTDQAGLDYVWQDGRTDSAVWLKGIGKFSVTAIQGFCTTTDSMWIKPTPAPRFSLGPDTSICEGQEMILKPDVLRGTLTWSDGSQENELVVTEEGSYWAEMEREGCRFLDTVTVSIVRLSKPQLGADTTVCEGTTISFQLPVGDVQYLWQDGQEGPNYQAQSAGLYWVEAIRSGCLKRDSINISQVFPPQLALGPDTLFCEGEEVLIIPQMLSATSNAQLTWQDGSNEEQFLVQEPGLYWLAIEEEKCPIVRDSIAISQISCYCSYFVPTGFSPNGDGQNEAFRAWGECELQNFDLQVFNRWGNQLFQSNDPAQDWRGQFQGQAVPEGVYVWVLRYTFRARGGWKEHFQRGTVTLIR